MVCAAADAHEYRVKLKPKWELTPSIVGDEPLVVCLDGRCWEFATTSPTRE